MNVADLQSLDSMSLIEHLILCATERGMLIADGSPEEATEAQKKIDQAQLELQRRLSW